MPRHKIHHNSREIYREESHRGFESQPGRKIWLQTMFLRNTNLYRIHWLLDCNPMTVTLPLQSRKKASPMQQTPLSANMSARPRWQNLRTPHPVPRQQSDLNHSAQCSTVGTVPWQSQLHPGFRIRIRIWSVFNRASKSGSVFGIRIRIQEAKNDPQK